VKGQHPDIIGFLSSYKKKLYDDSLYLQYVYSSMLNHDGVTASTV
jgi:hypothetical protein